MLYRIEFENGSETYEHAMTEVEVREAVAAIYPNKPISIVEEVEGEVCRDA